MHHSIMAEERFLIGATVSMYELVDDEIISAVPAIEERNEFIIKSH